MKKSVLTLLLTFSFITLISTSILTGFYIKDELNNFSDNYSYDLTNFSNFEQHENSPYIISEQSASEISFQISHSSLDEKQYESYFFPLNGFGKCSDFQITVVVSYQYTGSMMNDFYLKIGSYYNEDGVLAYGLGDVENNLCFCTAVDAWAGSGGRYSVGARPNDILERYSTSYGSISSSATLKYHISRNQGVLNCTIEKNNLVVLTHIWSSGLTRSANFVLLECHGNPIYVSETEGTFSFIDGSFYFDELEPITVTVTETPSFIIGILFVSSSMIVISALIVPIIIKKIKK
ncbi:MAG: hypothetical protein ACTSQK_12970 [Candidatus Heimdallarchaeota archaeon]